MEFSVEDLRQAIEGDQRAIATVIEQYTPLVHKIVKKYQFMSREHSKEDLVQEGLIGIHKALSTYDQSFTLTRESWMTWVFWKIRMEVQSAARKEIKHTKYTVPIDPSGEVQSSEFFYYPDALNKDIYSLDTFEGGEFGEFPPIKNIIVDGCGSLDSKRAKIVCSRFGLLGQTPMRNYEVAKKFGVSKQSVSGYIARFSKAIKDRHPELAQLVKN
jgi:RNA polymerase sigma factor (sigma-70 family)